MANLKVMGIDPGTLKMGVALVEKERNSIRAHFYKTISLSSKLLIHRRLLIMHDEVLKLIDEFKPDIVALEDVFFGVNVKSAIRIGESRAAVIIAATKRNLEVVEYLPTRVKSAVCGNGRAAKGQVQNMVKNILSLDELPQSDAADALAVGICHVNSVRF